MSTSGADLSEKTEDACSALEDELRDAPADQRAAYDEDDARTQIRVVDDECAEASGPRTVKGRAADLRAARNEEVAVAAGPCTDQEFRREAKLQPERHHDRRRYRRRKDHARSEECSNAENERRALSNAREDIGEQLRVQVKERPRTPGNTEDAYNADQTGACLLYTSDAADD